jgi:hypothetical protein
MKIHSIYDAGDTFADRYSVYYKGRGTLACVPGEKKRMRMCRAMSGAPCHPQGFGQMTSGLPGKHNGKRIQFEDLPEACQKLVLRDLES